LKKQGEFDNELLRDQRDLILKGLNALDAEFDQLEESKEDPNKGKSLQELMREKREATEKILESTKTGKESIEERKKRL